MGSVKMRALEHDCPWNFDCLCLRDGTLCSCLHQSGVHVPGCADCDCAGFRSVTA